MLRFEHGSLRRLRFENTYLRSKHRLLVNLGHLFGNGSVFRRDDRVMRLRRNKNMYLGVLLGKLCR
jgi:hypothetical protein